ncbi:MAG: tetratricopeptide repeat protein [Candidatus Thermoplasmatota archaeon]
MDSIEEELAGGEALLAKQDFQGAMQCFDKALKSDPNAARAYFGKAEAALGIPRTPAEDILAWYKKAVELDPQNTFYLTTMGSFCLEMGWFSEAEECYNRATELDEENAPLYLSEFGIGYYMRAPVVMEKFLDQTTWRMIKRKSLEYLLRAIDTSAEQAKEMLG